MNSMGKKKSTVKLDNESPVILTAATREELAEKFSTFASQHKGATLTAGAVGRNKDDGTYSLRIDFETK